MTTNAGNSNLLGASGNVPGHYPKGNISFHDLVNHSIFEGKIFVFDPGFLEELHPVNDLTGLFWTKRCERMSLAKELGDAEEAV
jgi:hypothetical protein